MKDLLAIPSVLNDITSKWRGGLASLGSASLRTARCLVAAMKDAMQRNASTHLVVIGQEVSQYVGEQFAADVVEFVRRGGGGVCACAIVVVCA